MLALSWCGDDGNCSVNRDNHASCAWTGATSGDHDNPSPIGDASGSVTSGYGGRGGESGSGSTSDDGRPRFVRSASKSRRRNASQSGRPNESGGGKGGGQLNPVVSYVYRDREVIEALADQVELNSLIMTANKRSFMAEQAARVKAGVAAIQAGLNGVATTTAPATGAPDAIVNRSPTETTTNNNYPVRSDAPWVALIALLVIAGLALAWMWMAAQPKAAATTTPTETTKPAAPTTKPTTPTTTGTAQPNPNYIEFYRP